MNKKVLVIIDIILFIFTIFIYKYIFDVETRKNIYTQESVQLAEENEKQVFKIEKIILWSSAYAVDNSEGELKDVDISQFTDIEIYINNLSKSQELTGENTVNEMFITNMKIETNELNRDVRLNYKNPYDCGKFVDLESWRDDGILFKILNTNKKEEEADYNQSVFFTDCSNPITLGYVNKNFLSNCEIVGEEGIISFDGAILSKINQDLENLNSKISFDINLINNFNESYVCKVNFNIDLTANNKAIKSGYLKQEIIPEEKNMVFIKQNS